MYSDVTSPTQTVSTDDIYIEFTRVVSPADKIKEFNKKKLIESKY